MFFVYQERPQCPAMAKMSSLSHTSSHSRTLTNYTVSNTVSSKYLEFTQLPAARVQGLLSAFFGNFESKIHKNLPAYTKRSNGSHFVTWPRDRSIRDPIQMPSTDVILWLKSPSCWSTQLRCGVMEN